MRRTRRLASLQDGTGRTDPGPKIFLFSLFSLFFIVFHYFSLLSFIQKTRKKTRRGPRGISLPAILKKRGKKTRAAIWCARAVFAMEISSVDCMHVPFAFSGIGMFLKEISALLAVWPFLFLFKEKETARRPTMRILLRNSFRKH